MILHGKDADQPGADESEGLSAWTHQHHRLILCSGCFDGLHAGHVAYLRAVERLSGYDPRLVFCAVAPDAYIRRVKGREPRWTQEDRRVVVDACKPVNVAFIHDTQSIAKDILRTRPSMLVKGVEWAGQLSDDVVQACREVGCQIVYVEMVPVKHTSDV